jgi:hypothetical protein
MRTLAPTQAEDAWKKHFWPVFCQTTGTDIVIRRSLKEYDSAHDFSTALWGALRGSLDVYFETHENGKDMKLKGSNIGFATDIFQTNRLGLRKPSGPSISGNADHTCVVFGEHGIDDATATIQLKVSKSTSSVRANVSNSPWLSEDHYSIAEAVSHTMDTWYALARRGETATSLPVVVLGAMKTSHPHGSPLLQRGHP